MFRSKLRLIVEYFLRTRNEELSQATARVVFSVIISILFLVYNFALESETIELIHLIVQFFLLYSILNWFHIFFYNREYLLRKLIAITADMSAVSTMLYFTGAEGSFLFPIYFWVVVGNGVRFGTRYLFFSMVLALLGFGWVLKMSPFWQQLPSLGYGLLLSIIILPLFYFVIMHRLHRKNNLLIEQLKSSMYEALHDPLTSLPNRAFLLAQMQDFANKERPYFLFFIDLDGFKNINDIYGHDAGDNVLKDTASRLNNILNTSKGFAARLGGDEFAVIAELKSRDEIVHLANRLINAICMPYKGCPSKISASVGITHFEPTQPQEIETLLKQADRAMYAIKAEGKNGFRCYQELKELR